MAKKAAPKPQLVHIPTSGSAPLSKAQKEFNRLTKRIATLEKEVTVFREAVDRLRQRVQTEYRPLQDEHNRVRAGLVRQLDLAFDTYKLTKGERNKIAEIIGNGCFDLLEKGHPDLKPIIDKHAPPPSDEEAAELDQVISEAMKGFYTQQFGIEFDPEVDVSTQEKFQTYVAQKLAEQEAEFEAEDARQAERRAKRKKSPKQQAAEDKKLAEERTITKTVRGLYLDLVKALHPDREPDEAEKVRKTELMKQVTAAYEANELLTLLRLQLELNHIDQSHLENLAEDQLKHYNKLLREQVRELDDKLYEQQMEASHFTKQPFYMVSSPTALDYDFLRQKAGLEAKIKQLAAEVLALGHDPAALKMWLKDFKVPRKGSGPGPMIIQL